MPVQSGSLKRFGYPRQVWPTLFLLNVFTALKGTHFYIFICLLSTFFTEYYLLSGTSYEGTSNCFMSTYSTIKYFHFWYIICKCVYLLYVYLFHRHVSFLPFSQYTISRSGILYVGTSNCFVYLFHGHTSCLPFSRYTISLSGTLYVGLSNCFMSTYSWTCVLSTFYTVYNFTFSYIICRNRKLLNVYLFLGHSTCLHFSQCTILLSGTLYVGTSNCLMSTHFTGMLLVYIFHNILFYFLVQYM